MSVSKKFDVTAFPNILCLCYTSTILIVLCFLPITVLVDFIYLRFLQPAVESCKQKMPFNKITIRSSFLLPFVPLSMILWPLGGIIGAKVFVEQTNKLYSLDTVFAHTHHKGNRTFLILFLDFWLPIPHAGRQFT